MIKFLLRRPIATCILALSLFILGLVSYNRLPVSLLPNIDIPRIVVKLNYADYSAQDMERSIASRVRQSVQQCAGIKEVYSESSYGQSSIYLQFDYKVNIDLAAIEVNEKIDRVISSLPKDMARPRVIKASVSDIPVFFLNMSFQEGATEKNDFLDLSRFAEQVIKKRIEQLPEVGFVDISGSESPQVRITLKEEALSSYNLDPYKVAEVIKANNYTLGGIKVRDGYYEYNVQFSSQMSSISQIRGLLLNIEGKIVRLGELADIKVIPANGGGSFVAGGQKAISLAIIKQADARMQDLKEQLRKETEYIKADYPDIEFSIAQDQTALLDYSISNLKQTLLYGGILAFFVLLLFIPNLRLPILIGITVPISITISLLFFMLFNISINIISLSGLVLGIGLMIDNSIIVIDNITQFRERNISLFDSCLGATQEIVIPLFSSACTTSAIFIPLIFISGMAGALFYDQAVTVTVSLLISFLVSITLLPVLYQLFHRRIRNNKPLKSKAVIDLLGPYEKGMEIVFRHKIVFTIAFLLLIPCSYAMFFVVKKELFPDIKQDDIIMSFKWDENLNRDEQLRRLQELYTAIKPSVSQFNAWSGSQDYVLNSGYNLKNQEVQVYMKASPDVGVQQIKEASHTYLTNKYPSLKVAFKKPENVFVKTFEQAEASLIVKLKPKETQTAMLIVQEAVDEIDKELQKPHLNTLAQYDYIQLLYDRETMILYGVGEGTLLDALKTAFNQNDLGRLNTSQEVLPIILGAGDKPLESILKTTRVRNAKGEYLPINEFIKVRQASDFEVVSADEKGIFYPILFDIGESQLPVYQNRLKKVNRKKDFPFDLSLEGGLYDFKESFKELSAIMLLSIALLYFILAIQFESLVLPFIILIEIPIDIFGALLLLYLTGASLNIMAIIGIIVMTGIIINDSILKVDTIHRLYKKAGHDLRGAIFLGGSRRLRPIILTSLTTILALTPFFFGEGLGTELQRPLALALMGGLGLGTVVSLYFIPLCYWWLFSKKAVSTKKLDNNDV